MSNLDEKDLPLPEQTEGTEKNIQDSIVLDNAELAKQFFSETKARLLDVNHWNEICGKGSATFQLTDESGNPVGGPPQANNYFKIKIPGPGTKAGNGYDWVRVEEVLEKDETDFEYIIVRVRPASDPGSENTETAHFFSKKATSNFLVLREGTKITAAVLGRNEEANMHEGHGIIDKIRNLLVGVSAKIGMADPQWKSLVEGLLKQKG